VELVGLRRSRLVRRHRLDGSAPDPVEVARSVVVLHATDPATVYLSVLARCPGATIPDVARTMYDEHALVRLLAMRRTLFVVPRELVPVVHAAASLDVAATQRKRLLKQLATLPTEPPLPSDARALEVWLREVEDEVEAALSRLGVASGTQLGAAVPRLRTAILPTTDKTYDVRRTITTQVLVLMGAEGRLIRRQPLGSWSSRQHTWELVSAVWPGGLPEVGRAEAQSLLAAAYLSRFGPATEADLAWWTGWTLRDTRAAVTRCGADVVDGLLWGAEDPPEDDATAPAEVAALLPALDPTPMGWKERDWFLPEDERARRSLYDTNGNVGPTIWWAGEVVGGWAVRKDGSIATRLFGDRGEAVARAVADAAESLHARIEGAVVVPSFRTPLERELAAG
jgi:Winged helix DNA-binding domain